MARKKRCCVRRKNGRCAKFKPPGSGKCLKPKSGSSRGGRSKRKSSSRKSSGGGGFSLGIGPAIRATGRLACTNPERNRRAQAIQAYLWNSGEKELALGLPAKGKRAHQQATRSLVNAQKQWMRLVAKKCLPGSRAYDAARTRTRKARAEAIPDHWFAT